MLTSPCSTPNILLHVYYVHWTNPKYTHLQIHNLPITLSTLIYLGAIWNFSKMNRAPLNWYQIMGQKGLFLRPRSIGTIRG